MSDIHIGKSTKRGDSRKVQLIFHIPITNPIAGEVPTPVSSIPTQIDQVEKDKLVIGELVEYVQSTIVLKKAQSINDADVMTKIKQIFTVKSTEVDTAFDFAHEDYGQKINATP